MLQILLLTFMLFGGLLGSSVQAQSSALQELAEGLAGKLIPVEQLSLADCPDGIGKLRPARVVAQYIQNKFYRWHEYEIKGADNRAGVCIVLVQPRLGPLSKKDAQVLLSASETWKESIPEPGSMTILSPSDPSLNLPTVPSPSPGDFRNPTDQPETDVPHRLDPASWPQNNTSLVTDPISLESVIGSDERIRVTSTQQYPWNNVCYVSFTNRNTQYRGTAFLVSPYVALTAGHNVYDADYGSWSYDFLAAPGQYQTYEGGAVYRPYGEQYASESHTNNAYLQGAGFEYDYAAVMFTTPLSSISTFMPVEFDSTPARINVVGYPAQVQGEFNSQAMWRSSSSVYDTDARIIFYTADTSGGNSGGPVYLDSRRVAAIHTFGAIDVNGGVRLVSENENTVTQWMQWHPGDFVDVPPSYWAFDYIEKIYQQGITTGCGDNRYCPEDRVTRAEMAVFIERARHGGSFSPPQATSIFDDVSVDYWASGWIEQLYLEGITQGCNVDPLLYCPLSAVTRAEMAVLLLRAEHGSDYEPPAPTEIFSDVPMNYWAGSWIDQIYQENVTTGCQTNPLNYCPEGSVTRAEMAAFIVRTFNL